MAQRNDSGRGSSAASSTTNQPGNQTPDTPPIQESDVARLKVDELRSQLRARGVNGTSGLRKEQLVKALVKTLQEGTGFSPDGGEPRKDGDGVRRGPKSARSLKYSQEIRSPDEHQERPGRSLVTTNHDVIRQWAEERGASPAAAGADRGRPSVLRFDFPGYNGGGLHPVSWEDWFRAFDERGLNFIYQEQKTDGRQSNFFRVESPEREDA
ncbi:hypothetical protein SAMN05444365_101570 [Micromonospora pattaloongensis]|uniref:Rho termination factor, N-terminal domain n=1 Tax=Micromonospora pattaloongensis TaxID=405436 RepID=A0A1H3GVM4_9ACTN|nr:hypothetical protein [Micromonospora pattaloongensis]SDY07035.1 hypothetical protein SAMN05444365_101570 [Micromonospora pattaloongensis]